MMWIEIALSLITLFVVWQMVKKPSNLPPGPWGLPLIGYLPRGVKSFHRKLKKLQNEHGDILSWRIGTKLFIFIFNYDLMKEAFLGTNFVDRPDLEIFAFLQSSNPLGVISTNGVHWHSLRRFSLRHLRDLGMGKSKLVSSVQFEATELVKEMKKQAGKAAPVPYALNVAIVNVIWILVADKRYDIQGKEIEEFGILMKQVEENIGRRTLKDIFPWMEYVLPTFLFHKVIKKDVDLKLTKTLKDYFKNIIREHEESLDKNNPRDYIDAYLIEMENQKSDPASTMSIEDLIHTVGDLFGAGSETSKTMIHWSIYYLATYQDIQTRLQEEIDGVLSKETQACLDDKSKFPYLEAFTHEILRFTGLFLHGVPHAPSNDATLGGYLIPKGTIVTPVTLFMHFDPRYFESPNEFRPERFLDKEGKFMSPKSGFLPFGVGRRQCLGESLARMEIFIFLSNLIQHFNFSIPPGKKIDLNPVLNPYLYLPNMNQDVLITER